MNHSRPQNTDLAPQHPNTPPLSESNLHSSSALRNNALKNGGGNIRSKCDALRVQSGLEDQETGPAEGASHPFQSARQGEQLIKYYDASIGISNGSLHASFPVQSNFSRIEWLIYTHFCPLSGIRSYLVPRPQK